jgi:hypothetical protein
VNTSFAREAKRIVTKSKNKRKQKKDRLWHQIKKSAILGKIT